MLMILDSFKMFFFSLLICFISATFGFYPGPMYGDVYAMNPFFQPFMKNQWLQPYFQQQISNFPEGKILFRVSR